MGVDDIERKDVGASSHWSKTRLKSRYALATLVQDLCSRFENTKNDINADPYLEVIII